MNTVKRYFNRVVLALNIAAGLAAAIAVPVANLDTSSTASVIAGLGTIVVASVTFLVGWQKHEARVADPYFAGSIQTGSPEGISDGR